MSGPTPHPKVLLQVINTGAWKTVARYDNANDYHIELAYQAVGLLAEINPAYRWRIATDEQHPVVLRYFEANRGGWRNA
jgi:hypothetical protein